MGTEALPHASPSQQMVAAAVQQPLGLCRRGAPSPLPSVHEEVVDKLSQAQAGDQAASAPPGKRPSVPLQTAGKPWAQRTLRLCPASRCEAVAGVLLPERPAGCSAHHPAAPVSVERPWAGPCTPLS